MSAEGASVKGESTRGGAPLSLAGGGGGLSLGEGLLRENLEIYDTCRCILRHCWYILFSFFKKYTELLLLCSHSPNDVPPELQRNVSIAAVRSAVRPSNGDGEECVCVYSNSRNDVPRVAQRYGTIAAHTRRRASVLVVYVVLCVHVYSFAGLIRRTPPPTFSDTAITDRHSYTTIFQLRAHWVRISWSIRSEKSFGHVPPVGVEPSTSCVLDEHPIH